MGGLGRNPHDGGGAKGSAGLLAPTSGLSARPFERSLCQTSPFNRLTFPYRAGSRSRPANAG